MSTNPHNPLVTPYTDQFGLSHEMLDGLLSVRQWDIEASSVPFTWPSRLKTHVGGKPLTLFDYQKQAIHHLARMPRFILGDAVGLGKTLCAIAAGCYLQERVPALKFVVFTTKSTSYQWLEEFEKFSSLHPTLLTDKYNKLSGHAARIQQVKDFMADTKNDVLIVKYTSFIGQRKAISGKFDAQGFPVVKGKERVSHETREFCQALLANRDKVVLILDECQKIKGVGNSTRKLALGAAKASSYVWALTATAIKNDLTEFYSIAHAIGIRPFGDIYDFQDRFCIMRSQYIGRGKTKKTVVGYKNVAEFKREMRPFFLGRSWKQVEGSMPSSKKLPSLVTIYHKVDLDDKQKQLLLHDIPEGKVPLPPSVKVVNGQTIVKERDPENLMTALSVYQLVTNHPGLLDRTDTEAFYSTKLSPKEECLLDMLDGDLRGEKVICYTKYRSHIDRLEKLTKDGHFTERKFLRITGAENEKERQASRKLFQEGDYDLIFINAAGIEGLNLQAARHLIWLDAPWSFGECLQCCGRHVRLGSSHTTCTLQIIMAKGTIDEYAIETLKGKKGVFEQVLGQSHSFGVLENNPHLDVESGMEKVGTDKEFLNLLKAHVKPVRLTSFLHGDRLRGRKKFDFDVEIL